MAPVVEYVAPTPASTDVTQHGACSSCLECLLQPCTQRHRQWQNTSRDACRVRGASSSRTRSVSASGRVQLAMPAVSVAPT